MVVVVTTKKEPKQCDRCKQKHPKVFYRYPHIWAKPEDMGTCANAIFSILLCFCEKCVKIFDANNEKMRLEFHFKDNEKLKYFYKQYREKK